MRNQNLTTSPEGLELIKAHESFEPKMYYDPVGLPTIGYGTLIDTSQEAYLMQATITKEKATTLLKADVAKFERAIKNLVNVDLTQNQFDALVSLVYNIGPGNFAASSLLNRINIKAPINEIKERWLVWNKGTVNGKKITLKGLVKRRQEEFDLYSDPALYRVKKKEFTEQ